MAAQIIDGKALAQQHRARIGERVRELRAAGKPVRLDALLIGSTDNAARQYAESQARTCAELGIEHKLHELPASATQGEIATRVEALNASRECSAIMVHMPLPAGVDSYAIQCLIDQDKDVEGVNPANIGNIVYGRSSLAPCTALAVIKMVEHTGVELRGKTAVVVGASNHVGKPIAVHSPILFFAQDRELADTAEAGDIIGIPNHGTLRIGDALTEGETLHFTGIPSFAPEFLRRVRADDPMKAKHLGRALEQIAEEGGAQVFKMFLGSDFIVGVVGALQFEVLADRIRSEYDLPCHFESTSFEVARWVDADDPKLIRRFADANRDNIAEDHSGATVFLARNDWQLNRAKQDFPQLRFLQTREQAPLTQASA